MKILMIGPIPNFLGGKAFGGVCKHISGLVQELDNNEHDISIWHYKPFRTKNTHRIKIIPNSYWSFFIALINCGLIFFNNAINFLSTKERLLYIYQYYRLRHILKNNTVDVIHVHSLTNLAPIVLQKLSLNIPVVITDHGFWNQKDAMVLGSPTYTRLKKSVEVCSKLIYISDFAKSQHDKIDFGQHKKLIKIKNPLHLPQPIKRDTIISNKKVIFFNGLTESVKIKNLPILLDAIQHNEALRTSTKLIAITNKEGKDYIASRNYSFEIDIYGQSSWDTVETLYKSSNILVVPSKSDSFGLVYIEALLYGMPIIGLDKLINEFQDDLQTYIGEGFDSNIESSEVLSKKILTVLHNDDFCYKTVYSQLKHRYSWASNISKYETVYKSL